MMCACLFVGEKGSDAGAHTRVDSEIILYLVQEFRFDSRTYIIRKKGNDPHDNLIIFM